MTSAIVTGLSGHNGQQGGHNGGPGPGISGISQSGPIQMFNSNNDPASQQTQVSKSYQRFHSIQFFFLRLIFNKSS